MDARLFLSTFILIFLAELGDKTQLAAMARVTTDPHAKWTVFAGASTALILSTLLAVFFGGKLTELVKPQHIKIAAGIMFLVFGLLTLLHAFRPAAAAETAPETTGIIGRMILQTVVGFEEAATHHYLELAESAEDPEHREVFAALAAEEERHLSSIRGMTPADTEEELPHFEGLEKSTAQPLVADLIEHEEAKAAFYQALARQTRISSLRPLFAKLAAEELSHAERLRSLAD